MTFTKVTDFVAPVLHTLSVCSSSSKRKKRFSLFKEFFRLLSCLPWSLNMSFAVLLISMKLIHYMKSIACIGGNASDNHSTVAQWLEHRSAESEGMRFDTSWGLRIFLCPTLGTRRKQQLSLLWSFSFLFKSFWYFVYVPILLEDEHATKTGRGFEISVELWLEVHWIFECFEGRLP